LASKSIVFNSKENIGKVKDNYNADYLRIEEKTKITQKELQQWKKVTENIYFPFSEEHNVYLQQDGFLDKELLTVADLDTQERPINQHWSWDRILRSPYIKSFFDGRIRTSF